MEFNKYKTLKFDGIMWKNSRLEIEKIILMRHTHESLLKEKSYRVWAESKWPLRL